LPLEVLMTVKVKAFAVFSLVLVLPVKLQTIETNSIVSVA